MNIYFTTDLHLDIHPLPFADIPHYGGVLLIAGDTGEARNFHRMPDLRKICAAFDKVYAITGNHEYYYEKINDAEQRIINDTRDIPNFTLLQNAAVTLGKYRLIANTLWTDMNRGDHIAAHNVRYGMNDYYLIKIRDTGEVYRALHPKDTVRIHRAHKKFIEKEVAQYDNCIVMTHHAPILEHGNIKKYDNDRLLHGYATNMTDFILDNTHKIPYWIHGHTHSVCDYKLVDTHVLCNPYGYYKSSENYDFNDDLILDLSSSSS